MQSSLDVNYQLATLVPQTNRAVLEGEMINLMTVWLSVVISQCFCYWISKLVPAGTTRLVSLLPIICFYLYLPLKFSSPHATGTTGFFFSWLANFKLLLFAFGKGPLSSDPSISLGRFVAVTCLPIKIQQKTTPPTNAHRSKINRPISSSQIQKHPSKSSNFETNPSSIMPDINGQSKQNQRSPISQRKNQYAIKVILLAILVKIYGYTDHIHPKVILGMYCFHIYFLLELILAIVAAVAQALLGMELEPQFNDPFLSTSLQDFWGKRWNLMVTSILRPTVYEPALRAAGELVGRKWAPLPAVFGTFVVSGLMHELILYHMGRSKPTFRMTWFFLLHGFCLTVEIALKKALTARWRLPRLISGPLTVGFVVATCFWLFLPEFVRCRIDVEAFEEYAALGAFLKNLTHVFSVSV